MRGLNLVGALGLLLWLWPIPAFPAQDKPPKERFVQGRLIVKYKESVTESVHDLLKSKKAFTLATTDASNSLDALHAKYNVKSARPLFRTDAEEAAIVGARTRSALKQLHADRAAAINAKFPRRAQRAPKAVGPPRDLSHIYVLELAPEVSVEEAAAAFARDPHVEYAQPDYVVTFQAFPSATDKIPNDAYADPTSTETWQTGTLSPDYA